MRRALRYLLLLALLGGAALFAFVSFQARAMLADLRERPVATCVDGNPLPYMEMGLIRQADVDRGLLNHFLMVRGYRPHRMRWTYYFYYVALRIQTGPRERRDLFSRLPCGFRPRDIRPEVRR